jgi:hypothetical protein
LKLVERIRQWCNQILDLMLGCEFMDFFISTLCRFNHRNWWNYFSCAGHGFGAEKVVCTVQSSLPSQKGLTVPYFTAGCKIATSIIYERFTQCCYYSFSLFREDKRKLNICRRSISVRLHASIGYKILRTLASIILTFTRPRIIKTSS